MRRRRWIRRIRRDRARAVPVGFALLIMFAAVLFLLVGFPAEAVGRRRAGWETLRRETAMAIGRFWYPVSFAGYGSEEEKPKTGSASDWFARFLIKQIPFYREWEEKESDRLTGELDPSYGEYLESASLLREYETLIQSLDDSSMLVSGSGSGWRNDGAGVDDRAEITSDTSLGTLAGASLLSGSPSAGGIQYVAEQLADYDFLMKHFYTVHPTAAAGRELMRAEDFLNEDFSLKPAGEEPQILIYHTHSQEEYADYHRGNKEATIVGVGDYLTELLQTKGYRVIHDRTVYDLRDGKLDRSRAYTYALEGVTAILQKHPSIEVVLDVHRDGVSEKTRLVTEIDGKRTASVMFFNGTSETPDGAIEYLKNPYRTENLAFSFQLKLCADARYPGFTRKIYLKGLRYNLHLRPRSALIEVGAQTNTYAEARNAMEPLAEVLDMVLRGQP